MARAELTVLALLFAASAAAAAPDESAFRGLEPVAGDVHQHAGSLIGNFVAHRKLAGLAAACPHSFGDPRLIYETQKKAGYDWGSIAHHDRATDGGMTGSPDGTAVFRSSPGAYRWWIDPDSKPLEPSDGSYPIVPDPSGLPDHVAGGAVSPGWNEALSLSSAAEVSNQPAQGFVAFAGREFTTNDRPKPPELGEAPKRGGHKVVLLPRPSDRICGPLAPQEQGPENACDETDLYDWVDSQGGVILQAHPAQWANAMPTPWHRETARGGLSDRFVQGAEVGNQVGLWWEKSFQTALRNGYRFFPAFGSDKHNLNAKAFGLSGCQDQTPPGPANGATVCWVPSGGMTRESILAAMRERRCYYARSYKPRLEYEIRDDASRPWLPMGSLVSVPDHEATLRVVARNALPNQKPPLERRLDRVELVDARGAVVAACNDCCTRDAERGDSCTATFTLAVPDGAIYPRLCELLPPPKATTECGTSGAETLLIGAPVFVNRAVGGG